MSNNNQPTRTPWAYIADLPVWVHQFLKKVPETELGECPESDNDDEEEDPSNGLYEIPLVGDDLWKSRADAFDNREPRDDSDDGDNLYLDPYLCEFCTGKVMLFSKPLSTKWLTLVVDSSETRLDVFIGEFSVHLLQIYSEVIQVLHIYTGFPFSFSIPGNQFINYSRKDGFPSSPQKG
jgi:hypothetical protein